mgnify:CR=1 FL=1
MFRKLSGATRVFKLNTFTGCLHFGLPCLEARYINVLEENIEWVVPPLPAKCRCTYILCPFPCDGSDETYLAIDEAIPIVVDRPDDFEFPIHKEANPNALSPEDIAFAVNGWVKKDRSGARASAVRYQTGTRLYMCCICCFFSFPLSSRLHRTYILQYIHTTTVRPVVQRGVLFAITVHAIIPSLLTVLRTHSSHSHSESNNKL